MTCLGTKIWAIAQKEDPVKGDRPTCQRTTSTGTLL